MAWNFVNKLSLCCVYLYIIYILFLKYFLLSYAWNIEYFKYAACSLTFHEQFPFIEFFVVFFLFVHWIRSQFSSIYSPFASVSKIYWNPFIDIIGLFFTFSRGEIVQTRLKLSGIMFDMYNKIIDRIQWKRIYLSPTDFYHTSLRNYCIFCPDLIASD